MKRKIANLGDILTSIGEKYHIRPLIYNPITWGRFLYQSRHYGRIFADVVRSEFPEVRSSLDVGSGGGGYVYHLRRLGIDASGVEYSMIGRALGFMQGLHIQSFDCSREDIPDKRPFFDLVYSIEVAEHIPLGLADAFSDYIASRGDLIMFSAAHPGQGGQGHINEQPKEYWLNMFKARGFEYQESQTRRITSDLLQRGYKGWLTTNLMVFRSMRPKH
jgi:SAM-dependent methyltransferase